MAFICNMTNGVDLTCPDLTRLGGVDKLWLFNIETTAGIVTTTEVLNVISAITFPMYGGLFRVDGPPNAFSAGWSLEKADGGNTFFNLEVIIKTFMLSTGQDIETLSEIAVAKLGAVVLNNNKEFKVYFPNQGLTSTEGTQNTGQANSSDTTDNITLVGGSQKPPLIFDDGVDFASTLALILTYEL